MHTFEYAVTTKATPSLAWEVYTNWKMWHTFANIYGRLHWQHGEPWSIGSRMEIEILKPVKVVVDHLIVNCRHGRELGWIDRALGITLHQWVEFEEHPSGGHERSHLGRNQAAARRRRRTHRGISGGCVYRNLVRKLPFAVRRIRRSRSLNRGATFSPAPAPEGRGFSPAVTLRNKKGFSP